MSEMTPENLREWATTFMYWDQGSHETLCALASAWEADLARIEALKETDAGKLQAEVDGTIRVQMSYIATLEASIEALEKQNMVYRAGLLEENGLVLKQQTRIEALEKAAREYADAVIEGNATLGQQKQLHDLLDQKGRPR